MAKVKREFTPVRNKLPSVKLVTIQFVYDQINCSYQDINSALDQALMELQGEGAAQITEIILIQEDFDTAADILKSKQVDF